MKDQYDVLVIGGGPGGAIAAKKVAESGLSVCIIEKRPAIGIQIRCAEGVGQDLLKHFFKNPDPRWIDAEIDGARIIAPDGTKLDLKPEMAGNEVGFTLNRKIFDFDLVRQAANCGADVLVKTRATGPIIEDGVIKGAIVENNGEKKKIYSKVVIAADGIESKFAKWCGIDTTVPIHELESGVQYLVTDVDIIPNITQFYIGKRVAPEGYLWVFPKGERMANIGIGISARNNSKKRSIDYLNEFIEKNYPDGKIIERSFGGVSSCRPLKTTVSDGLIIIGDAARVSDPLTGGGIYNSMFTGELAAETAVKCIRSGDVSKNALMEYDRIWRESSLGRALERNYKIKKIFLELKDDTLNSIIHATREIDMENFNTYNLIKGIIKQNPKLLTELKGLKELMAIN